MIVAGVKATGHGQPHAAHHLDSRDRRLEDGATGGARGFAHGQGRGHGHRARVNDRILARVVEVEAVGERAVGEHGMRRAHAGGGADEGALGEPAQALGRSQDGPAELLLRRGQTAPDDVENELLRLVHDGRGDVIQGQAEGEARVASGDG